ncbi:unnamed protein product [Closterium sp. Yama58-4]|nr:unnamed protein product [Closterium sp. Yama58-4]
MRRAADFGVGESPPQQPAFFEATRNPKQPAFEAIRNQPSGTMNASAARPPRLTRIDSSTRCGSSDADTRHSGGNLRDCNQNRNQSGNQKDGNQNSNQSGNQNGSNQSGGNQSRPTNQERATLLANILQELGRIKRQKLSHVAAGTNAGSMSSDESDADVAARSESRGVGSRASDSAMAACDATPIVTKGNHAKKDEQEARRNVKNEKDGKDGKNGKEEVELLELDLFCSSGGDTYLESGSFESASGELQQPPPSTAQHLSGPSPVLDLALHL